ncbi:MAG: HD-GYP domain-containing protein [Desulfobacteraceae bacterium]|nr:HD-GYP domain-containing protein [Desulfobacteraceae bacterium]
MLYYYFGVPCFHGLRFYTAMQDMSFKQLMAFIRTLNNSEQHREPAEWLIQQIKKHDFFWAELVSHPAASQQEQVVKRKERARRSYSHVLASVKEVAQKLTTKRQAGLNRAIRVVQNMVDLIMEDDPLFKALSTLRVYDDYTYTYSVNVAILSMCMGKRIMLSKRSLERLGLCGLLHDLGKIEVPKKILNKPGKLTDDEFDAIKQHSLISVRLITKIRADPERKAKILLPPFEHHLKFDLSGYPQTTRKKDISLFGRIIAIADVYDAITSPRIYRPTVLSPDRALGFMLEGSEKDFDPVLLKVFINMLGVYPVGTLLKLDKRVGLVTCPPLDHDKNNGNGSNGSNGSRPWVVLLARDGNGKIKKGKEVSLAERDKHTGKYLRTIIKSLNPADYNIQSVEFIL